MERQTEPGKSIPGPRSRELMKIRGENVARGISCVLPVFVKEARGSLLEDLDGNVFIDFAGGIGVVNFGHNHPAVIKAVQAQVEKYLHTCFMVAMYEPYIRVAERLNRITPGDFPKKSALFNSGAEAIENAVKLARRYTQKTGIVALECAFHGRTYMAMTLTSKVKPYKYRFGPFVPEVYKIPSPYCYRCRFNLTYPDCDMQCARHLEYFFKTDCPADSVAAVIAEPVQGEGGFIVPPPEYFTVLHEICRRHGVLLIVDEIQTGFYRTGYRFTSEYYRVAPDLVTTAKSLAAGLPLSALTGRAEIMDAAGPGEIGGTYSGNPVSCAAALAVLEMVEREDIGRQAQQTGETVRARLVEMQQKYPVIGDVRGLGAMQALELVRDRRTREPDPDKVKSIVARCHARGLLLITAGLYGNVIRMLMPVNIPPEELNRGLDILEEAFREEQEGN